MESEVWGWGRQVILAAWGGPGKHRGSAQLLAPPQHSFSVTQVRSARQSGQFSPVPKLHLNIRKEEKTVGGATFFQREEGTGAKREGIVQVLSGGKDACLRLVPAQLPPSVPSYPLFPPPHTSS